MALHVLRQVDPAVLAELNNPAEGKDFLYLDTRKEWFAQGYVDCDHPRTDIINKEIIDGTLGFAVWADGEGVVATFDSYLAADRARASAKLTITTSFDIPEEDEAKPRRKSADSDAVESGAAAS